MAALVFVYGSLLSGLGNHVVLARANAELIGEAVTEPIYKLVSLGAFPGAIQGGETAIAGELYRVSSTLLDRLDILESNGDFYTRFKQQITLCDGRKRTAWIYCLPESYDSYPEVESGSWRDHQTSSLWWAENPHPQADICEGCDQLAELESVMGLLLCSECARVFGEAC
jgi:gamma-glutamylcyclotransferase (GGCT)/AIG2-like uncharacterized protein YtfP